VLDQAGGEFGPKELHEVARVSQRLLDLADERGIGPGTSRVTMVTAAVDRATLILRTRPFTRAALVRAAQTVVETSEGRVSGYSIELKHALESTGGVYDWAALGSAGRAKRPHAGRRTATRAIALRSMLLFYRRPPTIHLLTHRSVLAPCGRCARSHDLCRLRTVSRTLVGHLPVTLRVSL
jgi:hypothetical protein